MRRADWYPSVFNRKEKRSHGMKRREFCKDLVVGAAGVMLPRWLHAAAENPAPAKAIPAAAGRRPNLIFILSDDVGLGDIGCCGGRFQTPHIDELAKGGIRFELCYSTPLCGPSRCESLTGRYPFRTGMTSNGSALALRRRRNLEIMMPRMLKPAGYVSASVGKWNQLPLQPSDWGFDEYLRFQGSGLYWREEGGLGRNSYTVNGEEKDLPEGKYLPDIMHDFLVDFITRHKDAPFYVHYPMSHVHAPIRRTPDTGTLRQNVYADNLSYMDKLVGKLVTELERLGLREKTLVVFTGDNGTAGRSLVNGKVISGAKGSMWEGGSRVPLIVNWPGTTPAGKVSQDLIDFSDFYPTFAEVAGAKLPEGLTIDGHSFAPQVKGQRGTPREWIYVELSGKCYVRSAPWKLTGEGELYDMKDAPFVEAAVAADTTDAEAVAARKHLQEVLDKLVERRGG